MYLSTKNQNHKRMKKAFLKHILLLCFIFAGFITANAAGTKRFVSGYWWQAAGYAGLGNQNELLAYAAYYTTSDNAQVKVSFKLQGEWKNYVGRVTLYARKFDPSTSGNIDGVPKTFEVLWDYRDPIAKNEAVMLSQTSTLTDGTIELPGVIKEKGPYILYIAADINVKAADGSELPLIGGTKKNYTRIGAEITGLSGGSYGYTNWTEGSYWQGWNKYYYYWDRATDTFSYNSRYNSLSLRKGDDAGTLESNGKRVLVPLLKTMFAPGDYYSKYYRIPALTTAEDGSLIAISDARKYHIHDIANDIDMLSRRSYDNGRTWSDPVTIARGDSVSNGKGGLDCANSKGFGDAALAALPNGNVICSFIHGDALAASDANSLSANSYVISRDNGQTWSEAKEYKGPGDNATSTFKLFSAYRGCVAPGNMCVVKSGVLAGKVIACFRTVYSNSGSYHHGNYFLVYDPENDYWDILSTNRNYSYANYSTSTDSYYFYTQNNQDDESKLIEVGENKFVMSMRYGTGNGRLFVPITVTKNSNGVVTYSAGNSLGSSGMSLSVPCNGDMTAYTAEINGKSTELVLHSVPKTGENRGNLTGGTARSGLTIYTAEKSSMASNSFNWTERLCVSDPGDDLAETAQYSALTVQGDGTVGLLFEAYPQSVYVYGNTQADGCTRGDFVMRSQYMNLRIGDIIDGATAPNKQSLLPPVITPETQTYDYNDASTWKSVVIKNVNPTEANSYVNYNIEVIDNTGKQVAILSDGLSFSSDSIELKWTTGGGLDKVKTYIKNGYMLRVNAKCYTQNTSYISPSQAAMQIYYFKTPTRKIQIVAVPNDNNGDPQIQSNGTIAGKGTPIIAGVGDKVIVFGGNAKKPYEFKYFTSDYVNHKQQYFDAKLNAKQDNPNQYTLTMPSEADFPDNGTDCITIYAYYNQESIGVETLVSSNFFNSAHNTYYRNPNNWNDVTTTRHGFYTAWCSEEGFDGSNGKKWYDESSSITDTVYAWHTPTADLDMAKGYEPSNVALDYKLQYPTQLGKTYKDMGLDLTAQIMSDKSTFENYTAVVMLYNETEGRFMLKSELNKSATAASAQASMIPYASSAPEYAYYLVNGRVSQYAATGSVAMNALGVTSWYGNNGSEPTPAVSGKMTFADVIDRTGTDGTPKYKVVFFIVYKTGSENFSVADLTEGKNFAIKIEHGIEPNGNMTGVDQVTVGNGLLVVGRTGCATFSSGAEQTVNVHNVLGQQVASFMLNGSKTISLPSGVYVAGGQKFIVK